MAEVGAPDQGSVTCRDVASIGTTHMTGHVDQVLCRAGLGNSSLPKKRPGGAASKPHTIKKERCEPAAPRDVDWHGSMLCSRQTMRAWVLEALQVWQLGQTALGSGDCCIIAVSRF